ncbi:TPA: SelB C-terminal domain-containing protein, partial [Mannheimia haemolytica]|nr:SelB C-terminal domain-containing protein [Mannheimia haemolytica]
VGDKLIIRSGDDSLTLAGAEVLEIHSPKRHKRTEARLALVKNLAKTTACNDFATRLDLYLQNRAMDLSLLLWAEQCFAEDIAKLGFDVSSKWLFNSDFKAQAQQRVLEKMAEYHLQHQDQIGVTKARLYRIALLDLPENLANQFIEDLVEQKALVNSRGWLHLPEHRIELNADELQIWQQIRPLFEATNQALWVRDIASQLSIDETQMRNLLYKVGKLGYLIPIVKDRFLLSEQIGQFATLIKDFIAQNGSISVNQLRDELQYGRKLTVQLIEYFDRSGFLRRKGDVHLLRDSETF